MSRLQSWKDIETFQDVLAFTGWKQLPTDLSLHHSDNFRMSQLKLCANLWWAKLIRANFLALKDYIDKIGEDAKIELYLSQHLDQLDSSSLTPELLETLKNPPHPPASAQRNESYTCSEQTVAFYAEEVYNGDQPTSRRLLDHIQRCSVEWYDKCPQAYLAPYTSIIGPSGVGKSFSVKQLASRHGQYVVYISFGKVGGLGLPSRSVVAGSYDMKSSTRAEMEKAWIKGLTVQILLARCASRMAVSSHEFWLMQADSRFKSFQEDVATLVSAQVKSALTQSAREPQKQQKPSAPPIIDLEKQCCSILTQHWNCPISVSSDGSCDQVIIAIDEARGLFSDSNDNLPFRALRTALFELSSDFRIFALFLDTTSQVAKFSPPTVHDPSQKEPGAETKKALFPPFYQFYSYRLFAPATRSLQSPDTSLQTVLRYGHPMFGAFLQAGLSPATLVRIVSQKIEPNAIRCAAGLSEIRYIGLLRYLVSFEIVSYHYCSRLVSGWMHILCSISDDRERVLLGPSISPVLSMCALQHLRNGNALKDALYDFADKLGWGHVDVGDVGEVIAGLCLVLSMDMLTLSTMKPKPLQGFLAAFLNTGISEQLVQRRWFKMGKVFFNRVTRFYSATRSLPTTADLLYLYSCCEASYFPQSTDGVDILVPVWIPGTSSDAARMGCILIQVKNRATDSLNDGLKREARESISAGLKKLEYDAGQVPVLGIMLCLRCRPTGKRGTALITSDDGNDIPICIGVGLDASVYSFLGGESFAGIVDSLQHLVSIRANSTYIRQDFLSYTYERTARDLEPGAANKKEEERAQQQQQQHDYSSELSSPGKSPSIPSPRRKRARLE